MATTYTNLPGVFLDVLDGQLTAVPSPGDPIFLILGTSDTTVDASGNAISYPYTVDSTSDATTLFSADSGLGKGLLEAASGGATNFRLWKTGAVTSSSKRAQYEELFRAFDAMHDQPVDCVVPYGVYLDDENIMDKTAAQAAAAITAVNAGDANILGRVCPHKIGGEWKFAWWFPADPTDLSGSAFDTTNLVGGYQTITDEAISDNLSYSGSTLSFTLTSGFLDDGAHVLSDFGNLDSGVTFVKNANLADLNGVGDYHISGTTVSFYVGTGHASNQLAFNVIASNNAGSLTLTYRTPISGVTGNVIDPDGVIADIGTANRDHFHEVNFAYQLADFCHRGSSLVDMRLGFIGVNPPVNFTSLSVQADWVGIAPVADDTVDTDVGTNGTGLLGNKYMAGRKAANGLAAFRVGKLHGGFFATKETTTAKRGFYGSDELEDANGKLVDIGKYLSVMSSWATVGTGAGWSGSAAATYAGFVSTLAPQSAPTNKSLQAMLTVQGTVAAPSFDLLAGQRYVGLLNKATRAAVITDGPTAALATSDYRRISTMRQVEECVDGIRAVAEPFLGEGMTSAQTAALDTAIGSKLKSVQDRGSVSGYDYQVIVTPEQKVLGEATVQLKIIPAFELRQITVVVGLSAS